MSDHAEDFRTVCVRDKHESFMREVFEILINDAVFDGTSRENRVVNWIEPESLMALLGKDLPEEPQSNESMIDTIRNIVKYSVKTGHPRFINQLFSGLDPYGLIAQWITDALNPSVYTYEVAPVFTVLEHQVLREMRRCVGYANGDGDGLFCPGGSMANVYGMHCARHRALPNFKEDGSFGSPRLVVMTSKDAHYSLKKAAFLLGVGSSNVYLINVDEAGRMDLDHLRQEIQRAHRENAKPIMISATAGTTVLGSIDPLDGVADICQEFGIWMHVDAAWGGGILMSNKYRTLLKGIER